MSKNSAKILKLNARLQKSVEKLLSRSEMKKLGKEAATIIRRRTLLGFGVNENGGRRSKLKPLSASYIEQRQGKAVYFTDKFKQIRRVPTSTDFRSRLDLSNKTTPRKSNLTLSGSMLDSLKPFSRKKGSVDIEPTGTNPSGETNKQISTFVEKGGRTYLRLSSNEIKQLSNFSLDKLRKKIKINLTKI